MVSGDCGFRELERKIDYLSARLQYELEHVQPGQDRAALESKIEELQVVEPAASFEPLANRAGESGTASVLSLEDAIEQAVAAERARADQAEVRVEQEKARADQERERAAVERARADRAEASAMEQVACTHVHV